MSAFEGRRISPQASRAWRLYTTSIGARHDSRVGMHPGQAGSSAFPPQGPRRCNTAIPARGPALRVAPFTSGSGGKVATVSGSIRVFDGFPAAPGREWRPKAPPGRHGESLWSPFSLWFLFVFPDLNSVRNPVGTYDAVYTFRWRSPTRFRYRLRGSVAPDRTV